MPRDLNEDIKNKIIAEFTDLLPMLRARLSLTQEQFGKRIGATRQTIIAIENKKKTLTWSMFLSMAFVFFIDPATRPFLMASGVISEDLSKILFGNESMLPKAREMMDKLNTKHKEKEE